MRAYGIEFKEGPDGFGVYASKDVEPLRRARVSCFYPIIIICCTYYGVCEYTSLHNATLSVSVCDGFDSPWFMMKC